MSSSWLLESVENNQAKNLAKSSNRFALLIQDRAICWGCRCQCRRICAYNQDVLDAVIDGLPVAKHHFDCKLYPNLHASTFSYPTSEGHCDGILSVSASFGVLVWVLEMEWCGIDNFTPQPIDPTTPVMIFAILYGLSTDSVLMLSRIHEEWERTGDNNKAVTVGLRRRSNH